ncbi:hypothetical protein [Sediminispirochaeta bajacaliforniensis]|uniref:hypothetical protein n=1 Tax=Sediminispirochaeta bajacaliforniensis TaxID=148 RepID=UPI000367577D|nr:hypothetical protein [Sediminispirochaeta bajacaliforniensis]
MEISTYAGSPVVSVSKLLHARYSSGRVSMPVSRNQYLYARFKNVTGIPTESGVGGFPLAKLRSIDVLIERLKQIKGDKVQVDVSGQDNSESEKRIDAMIDQLADRLHNAALASQQTPYTAVSSEALMGIVVNMNL